MYIDKKNFEQAYKDYFEDLCRFLNYYTRDINIIEDVVQDIFVNLWEKCQGREIEHIKTYLYNSARNQVLNHLRDDKNHTVILTLWAKMEMENNRTKDCVDRDMFFKLIQSAVDTLPEKCKEIFIMNRNENISYKDIASIKNISKKTVENQMGIALKKIREYLAEHSGEVVCMLILAEWRILN